MRFIEHTERWFRGESIEAVMLIVFGLALTALGLFFWKVDHSSATRALIIPLVTVGLFFSIAAGVLQVRNAKRLDQFKQQHNHDPAAFVQAEMKRVDDFSRWYRPLLISWSVLMVVGLGLFHFWGGNVGRAVGIGLVLFAVLGLMVDHTSEANAKVYRDAIDESERS